MVQGLSYNIGMIREVYQYMHLSCAPVENSNDVSFDVIGTFFDRQFDNVSSILSAFSFLELDKNTLTFINPSILIKFYPWLTKSLNLDRSVYLFINAITRLINLGLEMALLEHSEMALWIYEIKKYQENEHNTYFFQVIVLIKKKK